MHNLIWAGALVPFKQLIYSPFNAEHLYMHSYSFIHCLLTEIIIFKFYYCIYVKIALFCVVIRIVSLVFHTLTLLQLSLASLFILYVSIYNIIGSVTFRWSLKSVCWLVGRLVCHNFLNMREATLPCSYRSTYSINFFLFWEKSDLGSPVLTMSSMFYDY